MLRRLTLLAVVFVVALAGCGGDDGNSGGGTSTQQSGAGSGSEGKSLFSGTCGGCHTLKDAGTSGTFGPNLDEIKPDKALVLNTIKTGPGAMPENLFTGAKAEAVAEYVSSVAGK